MSDRFTPGERSRIMARVHGRDTEPEKIVRSLLHRLGYRFRLHIRKLPGSPDIVLPRWRKVIFIHGCFWHGHEGCKRATRPTTNVDFWNRKIDGNVRRDSEVRTHLESLGWRVYVVWQCETRDECILQSRLERFMEDV